MPKGSAKRLSTKRSKTATSMIPQQQQRQQVNAAVQIDMDMEDAAATPEEQQDPLFPHTPPPRRGRKQKKQTM